MAVSELSRRGRAGLRLAGVGLAGLAIVCSGVATYWVYRIGDSGAKAVWAPTQLRIDRGQRSPDGGRGN